MLEESENQVVSLLPTRPTSDAAAVWAAAIVPSETPGPRSDDQVPAGSAMEVGLSVITALTEAPPRTLNNVALVRSSPLPLDVRAMLERREFGRHVDTVPLDLEAIEERLPGLDCPPGDVQFLADDRTFDDLNLSVDGLLRHRKALIAPATAPANPRRDVLVVGAGPGGLMTAIQLRLRDHRVVVCEQRDTYSRNRYIGVYKEVTHLMASLGMPESMTYDFSQYRGKRGIMLADIQTFLHAIALKLGVIIYTGATVQNMTAQTVRSGELELARTAGPRGSALEAAAIGMTRWHHDTIARVRSGVVIRFDTIVEASGGRSGLREILVGADNIVPMRSLAREAALADPSLDSYFDNPEDHCAEYVESSYGCPPSLREPFAAALLAGEETVVPDALPCFVSNIDASVFTTLPTATPGSFGLASRIGDRDLNIPHDWVVLECRLSDQSLSRYHVEGPLPRTFDFGGSRVPTAEVLGTLNPVSLLLRIFYAMGVPFEAIDRRRLVDFYITESSAGDPTDIVSTWVGGFRSLRLGGDEPIWCGAVDGSERVEYAIIGEALQNAWYRFGVGVDDSFFEAVRYASGLELPPDRRLEDARRLETEMIARSVQVSYHLYGVAQDVDQGVVGPVLTEYYMDEQHSTDVADTQMRELVREGSVMLAAETDLRRGGLRERGELVISAVRHQRDLLCRRALALLESFPYPADVLAQAAQPMKVGARDWRTRALAVLEPTLTPEHRDLLVSVFGEVAPDASSDEAAAAERLGEIARGRYAWATPWVRACALQALDPSTPARDDILRDAASDADRLVAETAATVLARAAAPAEAPDAVREYTCIERVAILRQVSLLKAIPDEVLAGIALVAGEGWLAPGELICAKGDVGDSLYVVGSGRVRVHDGDRTLHELEAGAAFGELSLLDAQPRSASVTALEPVHLLWLDQVDFYALMSERTDVAHAVNRVLCEMVRRGTASLAAAD